LPPTLNGFFVVWQIMSVMSSTFVIK